MTEARQRVRPRLGDVLEIDTPGGLGYLQYVLKEPVNGAMIRVLPGVYPAQPDLDALVAGPTSYCVFFPVGPAANRGIVRVKGEYPIPEHARAFPLMRSPGWLLGLTPKQYSWWLWDGSRQWRVTELDEAGLHASEKAHWNDAFLIERMAEGWSPADDPYYGWGNRRPPGTTTTTPPGTSSARLHR